MKVTNDLPFRRPAGPSSKRISKYSDYDLEFPDTRNKIKACPGYPIRYICDGMIN